MSQIRIKTAFATIRPGTAKAAIFAAATYFGLINHATYETLVAKATTLFRK
jgi:hypothetical protein